MNRHCIWIFLLLMGCLSFLSVRAQDPFDDESFWRRIHRVEEPPLLGRAYPDSIMLVVSNRQKAEEEIRFMTNRTSHSGLSYFLVYARQGVWNLYPLQNLEQGLSYFRDLDRDWLLYVEGMGKVFGHGLSRAFRVSGQYELNLIYLDYPSTHGKWKGARNFFYARNQARLAHWDFMEVFLELQELRGKKALGEGKLTGLFHSMGNILLKKLGESAGIHQINHWQWMDMLVVNAPCVPTRNHCRWLEALDFSRSRIVLFNSEDYVLKGARLLSLRRQLGLSVGKKICHQTAYIDLAAGAGQSHNNFLISSDKDPLLPFYRDLLHGTIPSLPATPWMDSTSTQEINARD